MSRSAPPTGGAKPTYKHFYQDAMATREGRSAQPQSPKTSDSSQGSARKRNPETSLSRIPRTRDSSTSSSCSSSPDRRQVRRRPPRRRRYSDEYSRSPSRERGRRPSFYEAFKQDLHRDPEEDKPWWQRKTLWATIASIASVASVAAVSNSLSGQHMYLSFLTSCLVCSSNPSIRRSDPPVRSSDTTKCQRLASCSRLR